MDNQPNPEPTADGVQEFWRILRRRKGTLLLISFAGAMAGLLLALTQTPVYQARTSIEIAGLNGNFLNIKQVNPVTEAGSTSETAELQTQIKILLSESFLGRVLDKLRKNEASDPAGPSLVSAWRKALHLLEPAAADRREEALKAAFKAVRVRAVGPTRILEITADSTEPAAAADFANTLANEFISQNLESRWKATEQTSQWLARQIDDMRITLERSEDALQAYARRSGLMFTAEQISVSEDKLGRLRQHLSMVQAERIARQSRYEMALASPPDALPDVLNDEALRDYQAKLTELRRQLAELNATYTGEHPKVMRVQAQLSTIESALQRERGAVLKRIDNEFEEAERNETLIAKAYSELARQVGVETGKAIKYHILKREVDSNRQLYDTMLLQLKQSTMAAAMRASNVRVIDPARAPARPYQPDAPVSAGLGLIAGVFFAAGLIVMLERADRTIRQPGDAPLYLDLPELGVIPSGAADRVELITWQRKPSMIAESFRSLLMSILFAAESGSPPKTLVVTSAEPAEGKSTVVSNLGIAIAGIVGRVLLIDGDLRKPRLHAIFGMTNESGLSDILRERKPPNGSLGRLIRETEVPGLFVLTSGPRVSAATDLLYGSGMEEVLKQLRAEFAAILIDTPPMAQLPDARVMGRMADQVILVVRCGKTSRDAVAAARQRFSEDGSKILGTVLNDWNPKTPPNGARGHYKASFKSFSKHYAAKSASA